MTSTAGALPKAAQHLVELATTQGWRTATQHGVDSGGSPFVTVEIARRAGNGSAWHYKITWHTRGTGTYRLFSKIARTPELPGWHYAPSLKVIRDVIAKNPAPTKDVA